MQDENTGRVTDRSRNGALTGPQRWGVAMAAALIAPHGAHALSCDIPAPAPAAPPAAAPAPAKFSLGGQFCPGLAEAAVDTGNAAAPRSAQLALYERGPVSLRFVDAAPPPPLVLDRPAAPARLRGAAPQTRRIAGLAPTLDAAARRHDIDPLLLHAIA